ncbi:hypothetical protein KDX30_18685 [Pseudomonas sp. CDFA 553]|uniref:hypothetical protein n=1 Tax=Pseudomonas quasicaspiana TaxID=2829821 RepID=UPI001E46FEF2|nr:hypothetical protein [Pseudomonas quasicaspiana]MCD5989925.1 hypothetical protein [Pseudomonas quasicaspiana]
MNDALDFRKSPAERISFVQGLDFDTASPVAMNRTRMTRTLDLDPKNDEAAVVANTILGFVAGMSRENKDAVKKTVLLAVLVADNAFGLERGGENWFNKFYSVMNGVGWVPEHWDYAQYRTTDQRFTMEQVGLKILGSAIATMAGSGPAAMILAKVAKDAIEALQVSNEPVELFKRHTRDYDKGNFCIGSCIESQGEVYFALGALRCNVRINTVDVLFTEWHNSTINISRGEAAWILDQEEYSFHRGAIVSKLRDKATRDIASYPI